ncbi:hypothetical protein M011DRAFT_456646 [Sporormia fimetaria CBS 119925]|uniref:Uncharacterized protein n=1 Tax=Sporormia fimetaria CBS 119925 TaxID=1340428 RepID=A0A6A6VIE2_9PLEO|nr:hypothetical protein M011DRAFT_456646 [Sporormia fimetaria CBS 119925]
MATDFEKPVTFGATIESPTKPQPALRSPPSKDSDMTIPVTSPTALEKAPSFDSSNPFSAFYKHPEARRSMDGKPPSKTHLGVHEYDLEAGPPLSAATTQQPKVSVDGRVKECTMWPSRQAMLEKEKQSRRARGCNLFRGLNSRQRLWVKIFIGLMIVAAATGLGVGISRAVGGGVWASPGQTKPIPDR